MVRFYDHMRRRSVSQHDHSNLMLASMAAGGSGENAVPSAAAARPAPSVWASLDSFEATRKENERAPSRWAGVRLPRKRGTAAEGPVPEPLDIPIDDELAAAPTPGKCTAAPQVGDKITTRVKSTSKSRLLTTSLPSKRWQILGSAICLSSMHEEFTSNLKLERPVGVHQGDGTLSFHPVSPASVPTSAPAVTI